MSNRGRHKKKKYNIRTIIGWSVLNYNFTPLGKAYLYCMYLDPYKFYKIYLNEQRFVCRIEEDTERNQPNTQTHG